MRQVLVDVPAALFRERCGTAATGRRPVKVDGAGPGAASLSARALRGLLQRLVDDPFVVTGSVQDQVLDLLHTLTTGHGTSAGTARLLAAKTHITEHLCDHDLTAQSVARAVGVTARHLNRAFAAEGTTVARYVQARRLEAARADLTAPELAVYRVADIAARWGFASQAHFTRLFRARFGRTPSEVRAGRTPPRRS
jgi:AraC-like DNA-binding protein